MTFNDECPRRRESQISCRPVSSATFACVCLNEWNVRFSPVGPTPRNPGPLHCRIELAPEHSCRVQVAGLAGKDERLVVRLAELTPPGAEQLDQLRCQIDGALLVVLRSRELAAGVGLTDANRRPDPADVINYLAWCRQWDGDGR